MLHPWVLRLYSDIYIYIGGWIPLRTWISDTSAAEMQMYAWHLTSRNWNHCVVLKAGKLSTPPRHVKDHFLRSTYHLYLSLHHVVKLETVDIHWASYLGLAGSGSLPISCRGSTSFGMPKKLPNFNHPFWSSLEMDILRLHNTFSQEVGMCELHTQKSAYSYSSSNHTLGVLRCFEPYRYSTFDLFSSWWRDWWIVPFIVASAPGAICWLTILHQGSLACHADSPTLI